MLRPSPALLAMVLPSVLAAQTTVTRVPTTTLRAPTTLRTDSTRRLTTTLRDTGALRVTAPTGITTVRADSLRRGTVTVREGVVAPPAMSVTRPDTGRRTGIAPGAVTPLPGRTREPSRATTVTRPPPPPPPPPAAAAAVTREPITLSRTRLETVLGATAGTPPIKVVREGQVAELPPSAGAVTIRPGDFVFQKVADTARRVSGIERPPEPATDTVSATAPGGAAPPPPPPPNTGYGEHVQSGDDRTAFTMPYRWLTVDSTGTQRVLVPFFVVQGGGLRYDVASRTYRGEALVGVEDTLNHDAGTVPLPRPLRLQLTTTRGGRVEPVELAIAHTSLDYQTVHIEATDSTAIRIRTAADRDGIVIPIGLQAMRVALKPTTEQIPGFGLARTEIRVTLPRGLGRRDTALVTFSSTATPVRPGSVRIAGGDEATLVLRSGMPGTDHIRAYIDGVPAGETAVTFVAPWGFLAATLIGVLLAGAIRFTSAERRKKLGALGWDIAKGAPVGLLVAAASAIGLDLLNLKLEDPGTWIAVMITAALGAWAGTRVLEKAVPAAK